MLPGSFEPGCDQSRFPGKLGTRRYVVNIDLNQVRKCGIPVYRTLNGYLITFHTVPPVCIKKVMTVTQAMDVCGNMN